MNHREITVAMIAMTVFTTTGNREIIRREHFEAMRDGAVLANAGHFNVEIHLADQILDHLQQRAPPEDRQAARAQPYAI